MPKEITNDDLAQMIQEGFNETAKKADVENRFDNVDKRFDAIERRLANIEKIILENHESRIRRIEDALAIPKSR